MTPLRTGLCVLVALLTFTGGVARAAGADERAGCRPVHAIGDGQDLGGGNTTATITHGGLLNGTTHAAIPQPYQ